MSSKRLEKLAFASSIMGLFLVGTLLLLIGCQFDPAIETPLPVQDTSPIQATPVIQVTLSAQDTPSISDTVPVTDTIPPLPGMVYWQEDGNVTWGVDANGQLQKIDEDQLVMYSWSESGKLFFTNMRGLWIKDLESSQQDLYLSRNEIGVIRWGKWSPKSNIFWILKSDSAEIQDFQLNQMGRVRAFDEEGQEFPVTDIYSNNLPAVSPDGKAIAFDEAGQPAIFHIDNGKQVIKLSDFGLGPETDLVFPAWSSDQKKIAWVRQESSATQLNDNAVVVLDLESKSSQTIILNDLPGYAIFHLAWQPNGSQLSILRTPNKMDFDGWLIDTASGERTSLGAVSRGIWSPDGHWLLYHQVDEPRGWWVMTHDGQEKHQLNVPHLRPTWSPDGRYLIMCTQTAVWLTSADMDWTAVPIQFDSPVRCDTLQWLPIGQHDEIAYVPSTITPIPSAMQTPSITPTNTPSSPTLTFTHTPSPTWTSIPSKTPVSPIPTGTSKPTNTPIPNPVVICQAVPPQVDGVFDVNEWPASPQIWFVPAGNPDALVQGYVVRSDNNLYMAWLLNDAANNPGDSLRLYFDTTRNMGDPDVDDRFFEIVRDTTLSMQAGIGNNGDGLNWGSGYNSDNWTAVIGEPGTNQWVVEMQIDIGLEMPSLANTYGMMIQALSDDWTTWPQGGAVTNANTWQGVDWPSCP